MSIATAQVTVGVTATLLNTTAEKDSAYGKAVRVCNRGAADIFVGPAGVTVANGFKVAINDSFIFEGLVVGEDLYGIVATATQPMHVIMTGV